LIIGDAWDREQGTKPLLESTRQINRSLAGPICGSLSTVKRVMVSVIRIWADEEGESHLEDVDLEFAEQDFVPPAPPVLIAPPQAATGYVFARVAAGWHGDWHPSPHRELVVYVSGEGMIEASDGESRSLTPGTILLAEDTTGKGHVTKVTGPDEAFVVVVILPD
jgi:quercetin dioxygenase-like cupin family protein